MLPKEAQRRKCVVSLLRDSKDVESVTSKGETGLSEVSKVNWYNLTI